jgi:hypothetical protein
LLSQIRDGANLKRIEPQEHRPATANDARSMLLDSIKTGVTLQKVGYVMI